MSTQPSQPEPPSPPAGSQSVSVQSPSLPVHVQPPQQPRPPPPACRAIETHLVLSSTHLYPRPCLVFPDSSPFSPPVTHIILPLHSYPLRLSLDSRPKVLSYHHRLGSKRRLLLFSALHSPSPRHLPSPSHFHSVPPFRSFSIQSTAAPPSSVHSAGTRPLSSLAVPSLLVPTTTTTTATGTDRHVTCPPHSLHIEIPVFPAFRRDSTLPASVRARSSLRSLPSSKNRHTENYHKQRDQEQDGVLAGTTTRSLDPVLDSFGCWSCGAESRSPIPQEQHLGWNHTLLVYASHFQHGSENTRGRPPAGELGQVCRHTASAGLRHNTQRQPD